MEPGCGVGSPRASGHVPPLLGPQLVGLSTSEFIEAPTLHFRIEHSQGATAAVNLVVMGEIGEASEDAEQLVIPRAAHDLDIGGAALRAERAEPGQLVAALGHRGYRVALSARVKCSAWLAGLSRILAEPDAHTLAGLGGRIERSEERR